MSLLILITLVVGAPDLARLGADDWLLRERETERCDNWFMALLLPSHSDDAEIDYRVKRIRSRRLQWLDPTHIEHLCFRDNFPYWCKWYLAKPGRFSRDLWGVLNDIQQRLGSEPALMDHILEVLPLEPGESWGFLRPPMKAERDYERFLRWLEYHWYPAPAPHEPRQK